MTYRNGVVTGVLATLLIVAGGWAAWRIAGPRSSVAAKPPAVAPASVPKTIKEDQLNVLTLTPEAVVRLGIATGLVERKTVGRVRVYGGEATIPAGQSITVASPVSGLLKDPPGGMPRPGQLVKKGQPMFSLLPLLTPEGRANLTAAKVEADGQVKSTETQIEAARVALDRAHRLLRSEAGSRRSVDEAQAQFDLMQRANEAAIARRNLLEKVLGEVEAGTAAPLIIECPQDGLLRNVGSLAGQNVPAGAALFEVVDLSQLWVRVPVYVGDLSELDLTADAAVGELTAVAGGPSQAARPVAAPPSANPLSGTVDLFYGLDNRAAKHSPGQRLGVALPLRVPAESLTAPWAAVIYDVQGGTWVYEQTGERTFVRRRAAVRYVVGDTAVLANGPAPGTKVVTAGAAELFGAETGFTK